MAGCDDGELAVAAARTLLSLRTRKLTRWPDWIPPLSSDLDALSPVEEAEAELPPLPEGWPKRPRGPPRVRESGWSLSLEGLLARLWQPALARCRTSSSSEEETKPPRVVRKPKRESLMAARRSDVYVSALGSGPSTSGVERPRRRVSGKEAFMAASSPETPFDYAAAARSGPSSSEEEGERSSAKRKARGASRSGAPSSGDEGCSSPAKRTRADVHQAPMAAVKVEVPKIEENYRDDKGHLLFDLNEDISMGW